jgi:hypothetical protein
MSTVPSTNGAHPAPIDPANLDGRDLDPVALGWIMARSGLFPDITRASQAVVKIIAGRELGIGPFAAMCDIHLVDGSPVVGARILAALVRQSTMYDYRVVEWTNERCAIDFYRRGEKLEPTVTFSDDDARRAGLDRPRADGAPSHHTRFPRNMKFARAISNGVGLHCPDLTAGTPVYTPDELGAAEPDADVAPASAGPSPDQAPPPTAAAGGDRRPHGGGLDDLEALRAGDLADAARDGGYAAATVVELCRFYYDQPALAELGEGPAAEMAARLRLARVQGISDERLRALARRGRDLGHPEQARRAADLWLSFRAPDARRDRPAA